MHYRNPELLLSEDTVEDHMELISFQAIIYTTRSGGETPVPPPRCAPPNRLAHLKQLLMKI